MKSISLKHTTLHCILLGITFFFTSQFSSFAQQIIKTDSAAVIKESKHQKAIEFNGNDGPYIFDNNRSYTVTSENKLIVSPLFNRDSIAVKIDNSDKDEFYLSLEDSYSIPETVYGYQDKITVISDIEGNFNAFASFLFANKIIDANHDWIYGDGHLVLGGDFVDRGKNVTQVLWLIYKLDHQAKKQSGQVHFILGNHEILNFYGDHRYNRGKYIKAALEISQLEDKKEALKFLYSKESELGKWLSTKNIIERIGDYLFVHAGISSEILDYNLLIEEINDHVRSQFYTTEIPKDKAVKFLYSLKGPFWYRGLVKRRFQYDKIKAKELESILKYFGVKKIVVGHTPVEDISSGFNGSVIMTDVKHGHTKFSGETKGLLIENNQEFIINDTGLKTPLKH